MRVSQLDSHQLDQELFTLLSANLEASLSLFATTSTLSTISKVCLRAVIWKLGIWDNNNTYGAQLQSLRYLNLTPAKKLLLGFVSIFGPVLQERIGGGLQGKWRTLIAYAEGVYEVLALANFISYIAGARYDSVLHRVLKIQLRPTSSAYRAVSFEFLNRQLIWSQFTEFLLVFLPLLHLPRLRRRMAAYLPQPEAQKLGFLPKKVCAICYSEGIDGADIVNPYQADCGDLYCYGCIVSQLKLAEGEGWDCLRCGRRVRTAGAWRDVVDETKLLNVENASTDNEDSSSDDDEDDDNDDNDGEEEEPGDDSGSSWNE
ncbi:putative Peroxisome biosynthesis protein [Taphrina deformans PYCC 5710]|uniref:RING-type E3 ubiquitin transferase (cysteine targeting) n=1 Tax=Taphrina deformans (strain PYCC 5710 / ATCC 11124 / CBS 356.35 / IMI 108563 / JCM 9778 / NBRC 8474) TaxID=1097556 RepID=R4X6I8_TAPDE|nr:putative Peroxisome biosynthesis protein [Taphrina deformans PYCC 5710]|eukprot:CCG80730.1 putative Peroxisome biosynthesis protein [Taphrina deformans PYCC 5710]